MTIKSWSEIGSPAGAWVACDYEPGNDDFEVTQYGDRRLWGEVEDTFRWVISHDSPDRFGLLVTPEQQRPWLDRPTSLVARP